MKIVADGAILNWPRNITTDEFVSALQITNLTSTELQDDNTYEKHAHIILAVALMRRWPHRKTSWTKDRFDRIRHVEIG